MPDPTPRPLLPVYRPPAHGTPDPFVVTGHRLSGVRVVLVGAGTTIWLASVVAALKPPLPWSVAGLAVALVCGVLLALRARRLGRATPSVVASAEDLTVVDRLGVRHHEVWDDVVSIDLVQSESLRSLRMRWTCVDGRTVAVDLGSSISLLEVQSGIASRAPATLTLTRRTVERKDAPGV